MARKKNKEELANIWHFFLACTLGVYVGIFCLVAPLAYMFFVDGEPYLHKLSDLEYFYIGLGCTAIWYAIGFVVGRRERMRRLYAVTIIAFPADDARTAKHAIWDQLKKSANKIFTPAFKILVLPLAALLTAFGIKACLSLLTVVLPGDRFTATYEVAKIEVYQCYKSGNTHHLYLTLVDSHHRKIRYLHLPYDRFGHPEIGHHHAIVLQGKSGIWGQYVDHIKLAQPEVSKSELMPDFPRWISGG